jgi:hypothetical protein
MKYNAPERACIIGDIVEAGYGETETGSIRHAPQITSVAFTRLLLTNALFLGIL